MLNGVKRPLDVSTIVLGGMHENLNLYHDIHVT